MNTQPCKNAVNLVLTHADEVCVNENKPCGLILKKKVGPEINHSCHRERPLSQREPSPRLGAELLRLLLTRNAEGS